MLLSHCGVLGLSNPAQQTAPSIHRQWCWAFHSAAAHVEAIRSCQGSWSRPDPSHLLCAFSHFFALFFMKIWRVHANNFPIRPRPAPEKCEKPRPAFSWEPQILLHTNLPLISWTVRNGKTLVLLWGEGGSLTDKVLLLTRVELKEDSYRRFGILKRPFAYLRLY